VLCGVLSRCLSFTSFIHVNVQQVGGVFNEGRLSFKSLSRVFNRVQGKRGESCACVTSVQCISRVNCVDQLNA
jgi:hypothetical protein